MWFDICMCVLTMMVDEHKDEDVMSHYWGDYLYMHKDVHEELQLCFCLFGVLKYIIM